MINSIRWSGKRGDRRTSQFSASSGGYSGRYQSRRGVLEFGPLSLVPVRGQATVTETRTTGDTFRDHVGILRTALVNEIIVPGARRAHNPLSKCTDDSGIAGGGTTPPTVTTSTTYLSKTCCAVTFTSAMTSTGFGGCRAVGTSFTTTASSAYAWRGKFSLSRALVGAETLVVFFNTGGETRTFTFNASNSAQFVGNWVDVSNYSTTSSTSRYFLAYLGTVVATDVILYSTDRAFYNTIGNTNTQIPHEFVDGNTNYGAGLVGGRYFGTTNATTVASDLLTDATGTALTGIKGPQVSRAATQLSTYPRDFSNAVWTKNGVQAPTLTATGIDGVENSASTILESAAAGVARTCSLTGAQANSTVVTLQACVAPNGRNWAYLQFTLRDGTVKRAYCNISTGVMGTVDAGVTAGVMETFSNSMVRFYATISVGTGASAPLFALGFCAADNTPIYNGDGTSGVKVDAFQQVSESSPTSLILTTGGTGSRTATTDGRCAAPSAVVGGRSWTITRTLRIYRPAVLASSGSVPLIWLDRYSAGDNRLGLFLYQDGKIGLQFVDSGTSHIGFQVGAVLGSGFGDQIKLALRFNPASGFSAFVNGALYTSSAVTASVNWEKLHVLPTIATSPYSSADNITYTSLRVYASALSDARCIAETT